MGKRSRYTLDDCDSEVIFIGTVNAEDKDWVETAFTVNFRSIQEVFKLHIGAQCKVLPKAAYDKITAKPLQPSSARLDRYYKTVRIMGLIQRINTIESDIILDER